MTAEKNLTNKHSLQNKQKTQTNDQCVQKKIILQKKQTHKQTKTKSNDEYYSFKNKLKNGQDQ